MRNYNRNSTEFGPMFSAMTAMMSPVHQAMTQQPLYRHDKPIATDADGASRLSTITRLLRHWRKRATQRQTLSQLDDRLLRDIGVQRPLADLEAAKPFWRA